MKMIFFFAMMLLGTLSFGQAKTFFDFTAKDIDGKEVKMSQYKGKKILVVNVASECSNTPQYEDLQDLWEQYGPDKFVIIGFPANNFGEQEPGTDEEIKQFCDSHYHVTFPMMSKISVTGADMDPIYKWLTTKSENGMEDAPVTWNFQKFMINEDGHWAGTVKPKVSPKTKTIIDWIK
jgi:glutathione peroxidase